MLLAKVSKYLVMNLFTVCRHVYSILCIVIRSHRTWIYHQWIITTISWSITVGDTTCQVLHHSAVYTCGLIPKTSIIMVQTLHCNRKIPIYNIFPLTSALDLSHFHLEKYLCDIFFRWHLLWICLFCGSTKLVALILWVFHSIIQGN